MKILIVGFNQPGHMGSYLAAAASQLKLRYKIIDASDAESGIRILQSFYWRVCGKRPAHVNRFAKRVLDVCATTRPDVVITTGRAPLDRLHIEKLRGLGPTVINYSTDDPWNPVLRAPWFLRALPSYDAIYTTRHANLDDFRRCGVRTVQYLPFAYDPEVHRPWPENAPMGLPSDVLFVGGCDADRLPLIEALINSGMTMALFGGYWDRHSKTQAYWRGIADQDDEFDRLPLLRKSVFVWCGVQIVMVMSCAVTKRPRSAVAFWSRILPTTGIFLVQMTGRCDISKQLMKWCGRQSS